MTFPAIPYWRLKFTAVPRIIRDDQMASIPPTASAMPLSGRLLPGNDRNFCPSIGNTALIT